MQAARVWRNLACRPCRPTCGPHSLRLTCRDEIISRHAFHLPSAASGSQLLNDSSDTQSPPEPRVRPPISKITNTRTRPAKRLSKINDEEAIISDSLAETLQAHRDLNASGPVIRRVNRAPNPLSEDLHKKPSKSKQGGASADLVLFRSVSNIGNEREQADYEGEARLLNMDWEIIGQVPRNLRLPWMSVLDMAGPSSECAQDRLSAEIQVANGFFTPRNEEIEAATAAHKEFESSLREQFPHLGLDVIGSRASGLAMPLSDLDLNVTLSSNHDPAILYAIYKYLKFEPNGDTIVQTSYAAFKARVPIIVGVHVNTGLEVQIQYADGGYGSLETVKGLLAEHPNLRPLFKVLRHMIKLRGLSYGTGRITSYPLLNMIAVVLKRNPQECTRRHLGLNLLKFLDFWTEGIDLYNTGITHLPSPYVPGQYGPFDTAEEYFADEKTALDTIGRVVHDPVGAKPAFFNVKRDLHEIHKGRTDYRMVLHDPANPYNDLGSSAFQIKHLQATLIAIRQKVKQDMAEWDRIVRVEGQVKTPSLSLLRSLLEGDYTLYNLERKRLVPPARPRLFH